MKADTQIVVADVEPRIIKQGTPDQRTIYDVVDQEGNKWTAWDKDTAEAAWHLKGQRAQAQVEVKQNGKYTNRTLITIGPSGASVPTPEIFPSAPTFPPDPIAPNEASSLIPQTTDRDRNIWRQTATKVAASLAPATEVEFWANVLMLYSYYETGVIPNGAPQEQAETDDGIPF